MKSKILLIKRVIIFFMIMLTANLFSQNVFEFKRQIMRGTDDAEERQTGGAIDISSSDVELVYDGTTAGNQHVGLRFDRINIPKDAVIQSAYIQFWVDENTHTAATNLVIRGEAADNSSTFSTAVYSVTSRTRTTASVSWNNLPIWTVLNQAGSDQRTPDIKSVVEEIVGRSNWNEGNAITIFINGTGRRNAHAFEGSTSMAPQLIINYTLKKIPISNFPIDKNSIWSYNDSGLNLGINWKDVNYEDSTWKFFLGKFGYGNNNERTIVNFGSNPSNKFVTTYFRKRFFVSDSSQFDSLLCRILVDDGAVVYINGEEVFRRNMPSGNINHQTLATKSVSGLEEETYFQHRIKSNLRNGINTIAVEVHLCDPESVDKGFDLELVPKKKDMVVTNFPIKKGDQWYYDDNGNNLYLTNWTSENYPNETLWDYGAAPLGYGDPMTTTIGFGGNSANKHVAYFFRKKIFIADTNLIPDLLDFNIRRDDGAVVYINGIEVLRQNMPSGPLNHRSISSSIIDGSNETTYFTTTVSRSFFKNGVNQIAVTIHQRDSISSDLGFDMEIVKHLRPNPVAMGCIDGENHISCYTSLQPATQTTSMIIPSTHNFQQILKQGTAYTLNSGTIPTNHDFTAYIGRNGSSTDGVLSVNHENAPGGVTLAYIRYIDSTQLWVIDSSRAVNFSPLVRTERNCSGGITPWGTIITSEETFSSADANADGYADVGWNVEINPWTGKIMDYGTGSPQKLWALGRMSHENVAVANDSITVYQGEDGGTHLLYKYVADRKMDLSSGTLYVLKLDNGLTSGEPNSTTGRWLKVPNTTQADRNNTNSLALAVGGTQFNGIEDVEIGTKDGKIYFTAKGLNRTYRFKDHDSTFSEFETFVGNRSYKINYGAGIVDEAWASGNDNLTFDDKGNLYVLQDGSRNHMWMVRPDHTQQEPKIELFMRSPTGSEPTGMTFTPDYKFMFVSIQHPSSTNVNQLDATNTNVRFNAAAVAIISRKEYLGLTLPEINISSNKRTVRVGDSVVFNDLSYPAISSRTWVFEGAIDSNSNLKTPSVIYNTIGRHDVVLEAKNKVGMSSKTFLGYIEVLPQLPTINFTANKTEIFEGDTVIYTDLSTGLIDGRNWIFEGGNIISSTDSIVKIVYNKYGNYSLNLSVKNQYDSVAKNYDNYILVKRRKPVANFVANKQTVLINEALKLTDLSSNIIENRNWTLPNATLVNSTKNDSIVQLFYNKKGSYNVKLFVENYGGKDSLTRNMYITVLPLAPIAEFTSDRTVVYVNEPVMFIDKSTGDINSRMWNFESGSPSNSYDNVVYVSYQKPGTYAVQLSVTNENTTNSITKAKYVTVIEKKNTDLDFTELNDFVIYPNPVYNQLFIKIPSETESKVELQILDVTGKVLVQNIDRNLMSGSNTIELSLSDFNLENGVYVLKLKIGEQEQLIKFVKK